MALKLINIRLAATAGIFAILTGSLPGLALAGETLRYKEREATRSSDFFDQNIYNEGVNQSDAGRWGRKISGEALPSKDINIFDEVPNSEFFTNRHSRIRLSAEALEKGGQKDTGPGLNGPLQIIAAEQRGIYPRFWAKDAQGEEYLLEFDAQGKLELSTGAEVVAARFYYALGYFVPQFNVVMIRSDQFGVAPEATTWEDTGFKKKLTQKRLEQYLMVLPQNETGLYRASACRILKGKRYGSFSFESRRKEDASDLVNHRDLREIRALGIFAAWLNHYDLRESGTLDVATEENGRTVLTHYLADFSGALGATQEGPKEPMLGYEHVIDYGEIFKSILALGLYEKPWQKKWKQAGEQCLAAPAVGYFTNDFFDPARYKTEFPYEAFHLVTRSDGFWAAKLLLSFSDEDIRAVIRAGKYTDPKDVETLAKTLIERRDMIARYWLSRANPLDGFSFSGGKLSFRDLSAEHGVTPSKGMVYSVEVMKEGSKEKIVQFDTREPTLDIQPGWISANGKVRILIRCIRTPSKTAGPTVTITLNAAGVQGIHHED
jgi:hypothetical protein